MLLVDQIQRCIKGNATAQDIKRYGLIKASMGNFNGQNDR